MTDWRALAAALRAPIEQEDWAQVLPVMENLERALDPLRENLDHGEAPWTSDDIE
ncbi:MAG TPA: hypothetical protein VFW83_06840 [Bryobacteraceae bacterium]|nr:hypothetical protein [Bryobacteraceae bacterium]